MDTEHGEIARLIGDLRRAERERDDLAATLETRTAEHALAVKQLAAVTAERDALRAERDADCDLIARQAAILTAVADALKGTPPALRTHSHHDLGDVAASVVAKHGEAIARLTRLADTEASVNRARWFEDDKKLAAVTRELAVLRAQQAPLVACVDALRSAARDAGWRDADATGETLVAWVRRGEREACAAACERIERGAAEALDDVGFDSARVYIGRRDAAGDCARAIRTLPLDAPGGAS